jgi:hypothetical protein
MMTPEDLSDDQREVFDAMCAFTKGGSDTSVEALLTVGGFAGTGKGQPLDSPVMTPFGPKRMGDLTVGSQVSNPDGSVAKVLLVHELGVRDVFRVTFADGASTLVTEDHLWLVKRAGKPRYKADRTDMNGSPVWGRLETTAQLIDYLATQQGDRRRYMPLVPLTFPVTLTVNNVHRGEPVDPYVLGALIGDGGMTTDSVILTSADPEIVRRVESVYGPLTRRGRDPESISYYIPVATGVREGLRVLGLVGKPSYEKFIPPAYKYGPIETRQALIQGLMDTDGTAGRLGGVSFTTTSEQLADDVRWVLGSLGYRSGKTSRIPTFRDADGEKKRGRRAWTLHVQGRDTGALFSLARKRQRCAAFNGGVSAVARRMVSIEPAGRTVCRCITVDHPNGLYLTDDFIVTHNSTVTGVFARTAQKARLLVAYIAFTGRAASVLARSLRNAGVTFTLKTRKDDEDDYLGAVAAGTFFDTSLVTRDAGPAFVGTIHRLLYKPVINDQDELLGWAKRTHLDRDYDLLVVDEASMVSDEMLQDLRGHGVPILAVGDHGQLPPVRAAGDLMQNPDLRLETIHRQAEGNPIIALSRHIREGGRAERFKTSDPRVSMRSRRDIERVIESVVKDPALSVGLLCWTNKERIRLNRLSRQARGLKGPPRGGEVLLCLRNKAPVYNGMRGVLEGDGVVGHKPWILNVVIGFPEEEITPHPRQLCDAQFNRLEGVFASMDDLRARGIRVDTMRDAGDFFDFGYALTVHKSQGSQFNHAIVVADMPPSNADYTRWMYTAVTRGQERVTVLT